LQAALGSKESIEDERRASKAREEDLNKEISDLHGELQEVRRVKNGERRERDKVVTAAARSETMCELQRRVEQLLRGNTAIWKEVFKETGMTFNEDHISESSSSSEDEKDRAEAAAVALATPALPATVEEVTAPVSPAAAPDAPTPSEAPAPSEPSVPSEAPAPSDPPAAC